MRETIFTRELDKWWRERVEAYRNGRLSKDDVTTLRGIFYRIRKAVGIENMPKRKSAFYSALDRVEKRYGIPREELFIISEPKISIIPIRGGEKPILEASEYELSNVCALLYCEKSTILRAIEEDKSLTDRGIAIVKAMGFSTREVNKMIKLAEELGVPILFLTDFEPSGVLIEIKVREAEVRTHRLGIDLELLRQLNVEIFDVNEPLPSEPQKLNHFKHLCKIDPKWHDTFVNVIGDGKRPYRIEIDGVFDLAGKRRFIEAILERADRVVEKKPLQKVLVPRNVPSTVDRAFWDINFELNAIYREILDNEVRRYVNVSMPFTLIKISEIEEEIEKAIDEKGETKEVASILKEALEKLRRLRFS